MQSFGPAEPAKPQQYSVACSQGHRLHGMRGEGYLALRCPACGEGVFVLPRSPLPEPPAPGPQPRPHPARVGALEWDDQPITLTDPAPMAEPALAEEAEADIEWVDEEPQRAQAEVEIPEEYLTPQTGQAMAEPQAGTARTQGKPDGASLPAQAKAATSRPARRTAPRGATRPSHETNRGTTVPQMPVQPAIAVAEPFNLGEWFRRHRLAVIFLGVALIVIATVAIRIRQRRSQELPLVAEAGRIEGIPALDAGDFDTAHRKLAPAARAVRAMGGQYEGGDAILQAAEEAAILVQHSSRSLEEIMDEAARAEDEKAWQARFNDLYKGRTVIFDSNEVKYRILARRGTNNIRQGRIDIAGIRILESSPPQKGRSNAIFGARMASFTLEDGVWVLKFEPASVVVMTHWKALRADDPDWETEASSELAEGGP